jgi:tetratricopeptide (TPR) repeat protein
MKAKALLTKASAQLGLSKTDEASATADEGLRIVKDGGVQGQLLILQGDALLAAGDKLETEGNAEGAKEKWRAAAGKYVVPSQVLKDDLVTPSALDKAAQALERLGEKERADVLRTQLKREYPAYQVP